VRVQGTAGGSDVRALQEAAVLAELESQRGIIGGVRNLASGGERNAIREALAARAKGGAGELPADAEKTLDEWAAKKPVTDDMLRTLAAARAERVKSALVEQHGVDPARIAVGDPEVDREHAKPSVKISLAS
jgi:hypothetical protein